MQRWPLSLHLPSLVPLGSMQKTRPSRSGHQQVDAQSRLLLFSSLRRVSAFFSPGVWAALFLPLPSCRLWTAINCRDSRSYDSLDFSKQYVTLCVIHNGRCAKKYIKYIQSRSQVNQELLDKLCNQDIEIGYKDHK